jgi:hypothetical protein
LANEYSLLPVLQIVIQNIWDKKETDREQVTSDCVISPREK